MSLKSNIIKMIKNLSFLKIPIKSANQLNLLIVVTGLQSMESLCTPDQDPFQKMERRIESSLLLELRPTMFHGSCKRIFEAPESHGFYVRLHRPFSSKKSFTSTSNKNLNGGQKARNSTTIGSCLISIVSIDFKGFHGYVPKRISF